MTERKILTLKKTKPKVINVAAQGIAEASAKSAKITLVLDPNSLTRVDSIGKKQTALRVTVDTMVFEMDLNSKTYRKALSTLDELGIDNCVVSVQGVLKPKGKLEAAGLSVQLKAVKTDAAQESGKTPESSESSES